MAEPEELAGQSDSPLAAHVAECPRCGALAAKLLEGQAELSDALSALGPTGDVDSALSAAAARRRETIRRRPLWRWAAPLAAAAVLVGLLLLRPSQVSQFMNRDIADAQLVQPDRPPLVEASAGRDVLVFKTRDPRITVVWFGSTRRTARLQ